MIKTKRGIFVIPATPKDKLRELVKKSGVKEERMIKLVYRFSEVTSGLAKGFLRSTSKSSALGSLKDLILLECPRFDFERDYLLVIKRKKPKSKK